MLCVLRRSPLPEIRLYHRVVRSSFFACVPAVRSVIMEGGTGNSLRHEDGRISRLNIRNVRILLEEGYWVVYRSEDLAVVLVQLL